MFVIAAVLHPAIFRAGGILSVAGFFSVYMGANILAMDDILQLVCLLVLEKDLAVGTDHLPQLFRCHYFIALNIIPLS